MAEDPIKSSGRSSASPKKPLVIDLPAEEVRREPGSSSAAEPMPEAASSQPDQSQADMKGSEPRPPQDEVTAAAEPFVAPGDTDTIRLDNGAARGPSILAFVAASLAGGILAALAILLLALAGITPFATQEPAFSADIDSLRSELEALRQAPADSGLAPLEAQIAALEQSIADLRIAGSSEAPDQALQEVQTRLAELERLASEVASATSPAGDASISELQAEIEALKSDAGESVAEEAVASLRQEVEQLAARLDAAPSEARIVAIETDLGEARRHAATAAALGPAVAADALAAAVESGRTFSAELDALVGLGAEDAAVAALRPHAESGLPTLAELRTDFEDAIASLSLKAPVAAGTGTIDRLLQSARGLVEVRPAQPSEGTDPAAIVTRIRGALAAGDVAAALSEWQALPEAIKTLSADWANAAEARATADGLVARLRADALARLTQPG